MPQHSPAWLAVARSSATASSALRTPPLAITGMPTAACTAVHTAGSAGPA